MDKFLALQRLPTNHWGKAKFSINFTDDNTGKKTTGSRTTKAQ